LAEFGVVVVVIVINANSTIDVVSLVFTTID
jgi:F420-0:gamma-glutamyl ligase-like protein